MSRHRRPFTKRDVLPVLAGLMQVLRSRGIEAQWHEEGRHDHLMTLVGGDNGLEVHVFLSRGSVPRLGRIIRMQAIHPLFLDPTSAGKLAVFCNRTNRALYGAKLYLRRAPGDHTVFQPVVERGCLLGGGDLFRIADEFDLLATEYFMVEEQLREELPEVDAVSQASRLGSMATPVAVNC